MTEIADAMLASIPLPERYELMDRCMKTENDYLFENECNIGYPKIKETMAELAKNHRLFIVSNAQCGYPELCIDKLGLKDYVQGHMCFGAEHTIASLVWAIVQIRIFIFLRYTMVCR